ncbi:MAG TPA: ATP-binding protein, partial [Pseudoxanthomonas sp.]|nr:ATP-binding protein [Pseudoxanthomonas sp.]
MFRRTLTLRLFLRLLPVLVLAAAVPWTLAYWIDRGWLVAGASAAALLALMWWSLHRALEPLRGLFRALAGSVNTYRDGEFNFGVHWRSDDELGELVRSHGELGEVLRQQRQDLVQRELLLDTMVQNTPVAMLLSAAGGDGVRRVVYGNLAARKLLHDGRKLEGQRIDQLLETLPVELREAVARGGDSLFAVPGEGEDEQVYHLSRRMFSLNGRRHELLLIRLLTPELRRQEVQTWKKVIRVISHELNNSLAPIASLAHSGAELVRRGRHERLGEVFSTIEDRARHLEGFIRGYARFAKLPQPQLQTVAWEEFLARL